MILHVSNLRGRNSVSVILVKFINVETREQEVAGYGRSFDECVRLRFHVSADLIN